jgi:hypothetical protein
MPWTFYNSSGEAMIIDGGLGHVVEDTTPQLGGNLDMQANLLVGNGGSTGIAISANGEVTMAAQPAFLETIATTIANETGDATSYVVVWDNEVFDQNADFATSTFTAPITGRYRLSLVISLSGLASGHVDARILLTASNRVVQHHFHGYNHRNGTSETCGTSITTLMDMDASDTVTVTAYVGPSGQSKVVDIEGTGSTNTYSLFSGELVA